jgi:hypothetical protein
MQTVAMRSLDIADLQNSRAVLKANKSCSENLPHNSNVPFRFFVAATSMSGSEQAATDSSINDIFRLNFSVFSAQVDAADGTRTCCEKATPHSSFCPAI